MTTDKFSQSCKYKPPPDIPNACPNPVQAEHGTVCKCTAESCGEYPDVEKSLPKGSGNAMIVTSTAGDGPNYQFMDQEIKPMQAVGTGNGKMKVKVNPSSTFQPVLGFGGAFTDASAYVYSQLAPGVQAQFVRQYWGAEGIGYSMGRVPMNSADFSRVDYTMTEPHDFELRSFCLRDDSSAKGQCGKDYKATLILAAQAAAKTAGNDLRVFTSTWSAAPWYKSQNFTCREENGISVCAPDAQQAMACTKHNGDPDSCSGNQQCQPCPSVPGESEQSQGSLRDALLRRRAGPGPVSRDSSGAGSLVRVWLSSMGVYSTDGSLCKKTVASATETVEAAAGNCYHAGFLHPTNSTIRQSWANYFSRFISEYKKIGINLWGLTVQNEPLTQTGLWQSMFYTPALQAEFVAQYLGPTIRRDHPDVKIMIHDDATVSLLTFAKAVLGDPDAAKYVDGVAYHWYNTLQASFEDSPTGGFRFFGLDIDVGNLLGGGKDVQTVYDQVQGQSSDKFMLMSEACNGFALGTDWVGPRHGDWGYGYSYSHDVLWQLRNSASGWIDWNLILNDVGGPNVAGNFVDSPIYKTDDNSVFYQNPSFFHLAHFAKYIPPGSVRVDFSVACGAAHPEYCQAVAFRRPDGRLVMVLTNDEITVGPIAGGGEHLGMAAMPWLARGEGSLNPGAFSSKALSWTLVCGSHEVSGTVPWKGIQTVVMDCDLPIIFA